MPVWSVSEPYINLWLIDEPLGYQPTLGPRVSFTLCRKQRQSIIGGIGDPVSSVGNGWSCSWLGEVSTTEDGTAFQLPTGGVSDFNISSDSPSDTNYYNNLVAVQMTNSLGDVTGFNLKYPDGAQDVYGVPITNYSGVAYAFLLSSKTDAEGHSLLFNYSETTNVPELILLQSVVDPSGGTNFIYYDTNAAPNNLAALYPGTDYTNFITSVVDPFGHTNYLTYDTYGNLTGITDISGMASSIATDVLMAWPTNFTTPYGTTTINVLADSPFYEEPGVFDRAETITDPIGRVFLYGFTEAAPFETNYLDTQIPTNTPISAFDNSPSVEVSYYWPPQAFSDLSETTNLDDLTATDYIKARMRHWLGYVEPTEGGPEGVPIDTIAIQRDASPDGTTPGQTTWFTYANIGDTFRVGRGTEILPAVVARVQPDGSTWYQYFGRTGVGIITNEVETYTLTNGVIGTRTNQLVRAANGIDIMQVIGPDNVIQSSYTYNGYHKALTVTNAVGEGTVYTYNAKQQISSVLWPSGLLTTNIYDAQWQLVTNIDVQIGRTNIYTYINMLISSHKSELGLTTTNSYDAFQRLTNVSYPDGTSRQYVFNRLDLSSVVDRMGFTVNYEYNGVRQLTSSEDSLGRYTYYTYCLCGALSATEDPLGLGLNYEYDNQGRRMIEYYPDGSIITNQYDLLGRLAVQSDNFGTAVTNWFNDQNLLVAVSNAFGCVEATTYDINDRVTSHSDANGVAVRLTYDYAGRVLTRSYPDDGHESFFYTNGELVGYTNQLTNVIFYGYDAAMRKTNEVNANNETNQFTYDAAGDLLTITDGKNQTTTWHYDQFGRVTNKLDATTNVILIYMYDADNRITNRWSAAKTNTYYAYDAVGNLTNVTYHSNPTISFAYDADNRLTNMIDGTGTNRYTYDGLGQLLSEGGLWSNDTVNYSYNSGLRASLIIRQPDADSWEQTYNYDNARRLTKIVSPAGAFRYAYDPTCHLRAGNLSLPNGSNITNTYDGNARLLSTELMNSSATVLNSHSYVYNVGNQRTQQTFTFTNYETYAYDKIGQLIATAGAEFGGVTNRLLEQMSYGYDAAHNLNYRTNNALVEHFVVNNLNELSTVTNSGTLTVEGATGAPATAVTVNGSYAVLYSDGTFAKEGLTVTNGSNSFTAIASDGLGRHSTNTVIAYLPATNNYSYDLNGSLLYDGLRTFAYDDENQLISITVSNAWQSQFVYDGKMRRRIRRECNWQDGEWVLTNEIHYIYDGSLVVQERDINNLPIVTYTRGEDVSGSFQRAGGIGGILAMSQPSTVNPQNYYYHSDGNGNITALVNAAQIIVAKYLYDPFGNTVALSGPMALANAYRFSSKEADVNSGLLYYSYRFYDPNLQRWLSRDPIAEQDGVNLYEFAYNDPQDYEDIDGLDVTAVPPGPQTPALIRPPIPPTVLPRPPLTLPKPTPLPLPKVKPPTCPPSPLLRCLVNPLTILFASCQSTAREHNVTDPPSDCRLARSTPERCYYFCHYDDGSTITIWVPNPTGGQCPKTPPPYPGPNTPAIQPLVPTPAVPARAP